MWFLVKKFGRLPDDPFFEEMDPLLKMWMFYNWEQDQQEKHEFTRDYALFLGSFTNPEAAQSIRSQFNPDVSLTDEEVEQSMQRIRDDKQKDKQESQTNLHRRRRRSIKGT